MSESIRKRASRYIVPKDPAPMNLTARDKQVIKAVNDFRLIRQDQIERLLFPSKNTAQVRLRKLWEHKFIRRQFMPVRGGIQNSPILYEIDLLGVELLRNEFGYSDADLRYTPRKNSSPQFIAHTLGLSEIRLAVELSCKNNNLELKSWLDEKALKSDYDSVQVGRKLEVVLPDAYFAISIPNKGALHFFLEYDRGSENMKFIRKKMAAYVAYFRSGKAEKRYGTKLIRVLMVNEGGNSKADNSKRRNNLQAMTEQVRGNSHFYFTLMVAITMEDVIRKPIWKIGGKAEILSLVDFI